MSAWQEFTMILGMMLVTFGARYPVLALAGRVSLPHSVQRALQYVPVAVLTAITVPIMLKPQGELFVSFGNAHLVAGIASIVIAWKTRNLLLTILLGMMLFLLLQLIV